MKANDLSQFTFKKVSSGCYRVTYFTRLRGDFWTAHITCMPLIDATRNAEYAKAADIEHLRNMVKAQGSHYSWDGKRLEQ